MFPSPASRLHHFKQAAASFGVSDPLRMKKECSWFSIRWLFMVCRAVAVAINDDGLGASSIEKTVAKHSSSSSNTHPNFSAAFRTQV